MLPFTRDQFFAVFADYNLGVWPAQIVACLIGLGVVAALLVRPSRLSDRLIGGALAAMWSWTGIAYHALYFASINKAAVAFGALFVLQGMVFLYAAVFRDRLKFGRTAGPSAWLGWGLVAYAAVLYPLIGIATGHEYPRMPMFGITPCPVTLFSFGLLLLTAVPVPRWILVVPFIWSLVGGSAAFLLGVPQDWVLLLSGLVAVPVILYRDHLRLRHLASEAPA